MKYAWFFLGLGSLLCAGCTRSADEEAATVPVSATKPRRGISGGLSHAKEAPLYNLEKVGEVLEPFSNQPIIVPVSGTVALNGWAVDGHATEAAGGVEVVLDQVPYATQSNMDRGDVADHFKVPGYAKAGFVFSVPAAVLGKGDHELLVRVLSHDRSSYYQGQSLTIRIQ